jgi:hypothetical protein
MISKRTMTPDVMRLAAGANLRGDRSPHHPELGPRSTSDERKSARQGARHCQRRFSTRFTPMANASAANTHNEDRVRSLPQAKAAAARSDVRQVRLRLNRRWLAIRFCLSAELAQTDDADRQDG